ncbi:MAG: class I SAM-dependent RNA methyltransferase [Microbacteriaceae bacterium]
MGDGLGQVLELEISTVAHGGVFVARHEGRVIFVADAIPGERVLARVTDDAKKSFWRAETVDVLAASSHRRPHIWPAAAVQLPPPLRAGGAEFGHIELSHQWELKRTVLSEALARMASVHWDGDVTPVAGETVDGTGWRTRLRLHVNADGVLGPFAARSHRVIPVTDMPLATPELLAAAPFEGRFDGASTVDIVAPSVGAPRVFVDGATSRTPITERVGDREFLLRESGFWQVHRVAAGTLTAALQRAVRAERFDPTAENLDLYGGVGLLAAALADRFEDTRITTVEAVAEATGFARQNLAEWAGARAETAAVEPYLRRLAAAPERERDRHRAATVVLDPPRSGAGRAVVGLLADLEPAQLLYVACDPVALARDIGFFAARGYTMTGLEAFDLFPNTHHVEAVAVLEPTI